jgi:hypothetical protein
VTRGRIHVEDRREEISNRGELLDEAKVVVIVRGEERRFGDGQKQAGLDQKEND